MAGGQLVRRANHYPIDRGGGRVVYSRRMALAAARNLLRRYIRRRGAIQRGIRATRNVANRAREAIHRRNRNNYDYHIRGHGNRRFYRIQGTASGTTHTTTRMIVRKTPKQQRFLRKLFRNNPIKNKYVNRFGFAWMGASDCSRATWYSICHLKFNNITKYFRYRPNLPQQNLNTTAYGTNNTQMYGNSPDTFIYIGKCTFSYELYNPTNYIMTVYIYDLICKHDTPHPITYSDAEADESSAPENCMQKGSKSMSDAEPASWTVGDPTVEIGTKWNELGMKPTDYHLFNTIWKVKGMKKIILPPTASHQHVVVFNPKAKITNASLFYPREGLSAVSKNGLAGLTQATLFGFQGQVAAPNGTAHDTTGDIGTLPGKLLVSCVKKVNVWNLQMTSQVTISENDLQHDINHPTIFTDLIEQDAEAT